MQAELTPFLFSTCFLTEVASLLSKDRRNVGRLMVRSILERQRGDPYRTTGALSYGVAPLMVSAGYRAGLTNFFYKDPDTNCFGLWAINGLSQLLSSTIELGKQPYVRHKQKGVSLFQCTTVSKELEI